MGNYDEKAVDIEDQEGMKIARAIVVPEGYETTIFPLSVLDPITKVHEETFYQFVLKSITAFGLYNPLVIHPITVDDWKVELELDKHQTPPPMDEDQLRLRVQTGCNRYFALKELEYDAVECIVVENLKAAQDVGFVMSRDKRWQRGDNISLIKQKIADEQNKTP